MTKLSPTDLMRAALIVEGVALELTPRRPIHDPHLREEAAREVEDLRRLATGLRELACSTN